MVQITTFNISLVVHGTVAEGSFAVSTQPQSNISLMENLPKLVTQIEQLDGIILQVEVDPYALPKNMGIFQTVTSPKNITSVSVATRIIDNHEAYKVHIASLNDLLDKYTILFPFSTKH
jgi:ethanolamine-phosphate cytidylyltransferase